MDRRKVRAIQSKKALTGYIRSDLVKTSSKVPSK